MKPFIKEIMADAAILSGLIILPIAFLGPGWRRKDTDYHPRPNERRAGGETSDSEDVAAKESGGDRYIPVLHAFPKDTENDKGV